VLSTTIVDLTGTYNPSTKRLGALDCNFTFADTPEDRWCFNVFGNSNFPNHAVPSFDYKVAANSPVFAAVAGVVIGITDHPDQPFLPGEFQIETRTQAGATYQVLYDHVRNVAVTVGQSVAAGTRLGIAGVHNASSGAQGRVELQINQILTVQPRITVVAICPRNFGTTKFNQLNDAALAAHNAANPMYAGSSVCAADRVNP